MKILKVLGAFVNWWRNDEKFEVKMLKERIDFLEKRAAENGAMYRIYYLTSVQRGREIELLRKRVSGDYADLCKKEVEKEFAESLSCLQKDYHEVCAADYKGKGYYN